MALEKTGTPGIYKSRGKKGKLGYVVMFYVQVPDALTEKGWKWKPKGKRFAKYQDAVDFKVKTASEVKAGNHVEPSDVTLKELLDLWLETGRRKGVSKRGPWKIQTYLGYKAQIDRHIAPTLGEMRLSKVRKAAVEQAGGQWQEAVGPETVNKLFATLSAAFKFALKDPDSFGIRQNPMDTVERLTSRATPQDLEALALGEIADIGEDRAKAKPGTLREIRPDEVYSVLELKKIIDKATPGLEKVLMMTAIFTGLRHGELCGLRWSEIDLKKGTLRVNRSLTQLSKKHGGPILERPKTPNAYRKLDLPAELRRELTSWKLACPPNPNGFVLVDELGKPTTRKMNNARLRAACKRAGVAGLSMNAFRHSFASQQLIGGTTPLEVSYLMGHSSPAVTLAIYSHWTTNEKSNAQSVLANRIFAAEEEAAEAEGKKN